MVVFAKAAVEAAVELGTTVFNNCRPTREVGNEHPKWVRVKRRWGKFFAVPGLDWTGQRNNYYLTT